MNEIELPQEILDRIQEAYVSCNCIDFESDDSGSWDEACAEKAEEIVRDFPDFAEHEDYIQELISNY